MILNCLSLKKSEESDLEPEKIIMADTLELSWGVTLDIGFEVHKAEYYHPSQQVPGTCVRSYFF